MTKLKFILLSTAILFFLTNYAFGQGCSDAGFCTMNSFKPNNTDSTDNTDSVVIKKAVNNQFKIGAFFGKADNSISVYGNYLEYNRLLGKNFGIDAKLTTIVQDGNGISTFGFSDIF